MRICVSGRLEAGGRCGVVLWGAGAKQTFVAVVVGGITRVCEATARNTGALVLLQESRARQPRKSTSAQEESEMVTASVRRNLGV